MKILDSSVIIALFRTNETKHKKAMDIFLENEKFLIPDYVIAEVLTVLKLKEGLKVIAKCADFLMNTENLEIYHIDFEIFSEALKVFTNKKNRLSFVDTVLIILSRLKHIPLITFDKDLWIALRALDG